MAGEVDRILAEWLIVALISFSIIIEALLHRWDKWLEKKHRYLLKIMRNLYRELMVLGMISFGFIMYIFAASPSKNIKMTFEIAHIAIFLFAIFHTAVVITAIIFSLGYSRHWFKLEHMEIEDYQKEQRVYRRLRRKRNGFKNVFWKNFLWWLPNPMLAFRYARVHETVTFHDTRYQFIHYKNLVHDFSFASYLRKLKYRTFLDLVEIHWSHYAFFLGIVLLDISRGSLKWHPDFEPIFLMVNSGVNAIFVSILAGKINRIYWKMLKAPGLYFQDQTDSEDPESNNDRVVTFNEERSSDDGIEQQAAVEGQPAETNSGDANGSNFLGISLNSILWRRNPDTSFAVQHSANSTRKRVMESIPKTELESRSALAHSLGSVNREFSCRNDGRPGPSLATFVEDVEEAEKESGTTSMPSWIVYIVPRLGRVPSAGEKLFWFGWHEFYIWCVELVIFFSTVNLCASVGKLIFFAKNLWLNPYEKADSKYKMTVKATAGKALDDKSTENSTLLILALVLSLLSLIYVLLRVAGIMKKYIFVMNNASLLPKEEIDSAIADVNSLHDSEVLEIHKNEEEVDEDAEPSPVLRRKLTKFVESHGKGGFASSPSFVGITDLLPS